LIILIRIETPIVVRIFDKYYFCETIKVMEEINHLKRIGLNDKEALVYIKALELGTFSVSTIATKTGIKRPTCYTVLEELIKKNLITSVPRAKKALFHAENPEILLKQGQDNIKIIEKILPGLKSKMGSVQNEPLIKYYSDQNGIHKIFTDILNCKEKEYRFIGSGKDVIDITGKEFIDKWLLSRIEKKIKSISIRMKKTEVLEDFYQTQVMQELKLAPESIHIPETIFIYDNKVAVISTTKENFGFVVDSADFSETMKGLFNALWQVSSVTK